MLDKELISEVFDFYEKIEQYFGSHIEIRTALGTNETNFDRHFTSFSIMQFKLTDFGVRFSGNRAMFMGEKQSYEIANDCLCSFSKNEQKNEFEFLEKYNEKIYRRSMVRFS